MSSQPLAKPNRVLACVLCQQHKIKCSRQFPCSNCVKAGVRCTPATRAKRQRRHKFSERELLERVQRYEGILRQNQINLESLPIPAAADKGPSGRGSASPDACLKESGVRPDRPSDEATIKREADYEPRDIWRVMDQQSRHYPGDSGDEDEESDDGSRSGQDIVFVQAVKKAWDHLHKSSDHLLFGSRKANTSLAASHPTHVQIFRLWQTYLENVDPLIKVTHTLTLQARIIDAASDVANVEPTLEALMFSIYCVAILSVAEDECRALFGSPREDLLARWRSACQLALQKCGFLRASDRDCLTALFLYLVSVRPAIDPQSLSSMLGVAIRIAQRMGIHNESMNAKCTAFEAEMRRRLWWSLAVFENRACELSDLKTTILAPTWDCNTPLNVNDSDLRPEMRCPPESHERPTEAFLAAVRSELGDFVRHSAFHLDFTNPALKAIAKETQHGLIYEPGGPAALGKAMEDKYLRFCNPENPLHFMTIWTTRGYCAKLSLMDHYASSAKAFVELTDSQRNATISYALRMLESDTKLMTSLLTKRYIWLIQFQFPFPAYVCLLHDLRKRPLEDHVERSWKAISNNYVAHFTEMPPDSPMFKVFSKIVLQAWEAREAAFRQRGKTVEPPRIVADIKQKLATASDSQRDGAEQIPGATGMKFDDYSFPLSMNFENQSLPYNMGGQGFPDLGIESYADPSGQAAMDVDMKHLDWMTADWNTMHV